MIKVFTQLINDWPNPYLPKTLNKYCHASVLKTFSSFKTTVVQGSDLDFIKWIILKSLHELSVDIRLKIKPPWSGFIHLSRHLPD